MPKPIKCWDYRCETQLFSIKQVQAWTFLLATYLWIPNPARIDVVVLACNLSSLEVEAERQPGQQKFQAGMSYTARPYLKKQEQTNKR